MVACRWPPLSCRAMRCRGRARRAIAAPPRITLNHGWHASGRLADLRYASIPVIRPWPPAVLAAAGTQRDGRGPPGRGILANTKSVPVVRYELVGTPGFARDDGADRASRASSITEWRGLAASRPRSMRVKARSLEFDLGSLVGCENASGLWVGPWDGAEA
jgi:hypothetical protein